MAGTIYLGGGGSAEDEQDLWIPMLGSSPSTLYWPFALEGPTLAGARDWWEESVSTLDLDCALQVWDDLEGRNPLELASHDLLFIGGGNTFKLLDEVRRHGFIDHVRQFVSDGGRLYGGSAGAILAGADIGPAEGHDRNDVGLTDWSALDLLGGRVVSPHYLPENLAETQAYAAKTRQRILAIPERGGIMVTDDEFRAVGSDSCWEITGNTAQEHPVGSTWS